MAGYLASDKTIWHPRLRPWDLPRRPSSLPHNPGNSGFSLRRKPILPKPSRSRMAGAGDFLNRLGFGPSISPVIAQSRPISHFDWSGANGSVFDIVASHRVSFRFWFLHPCQHVRFGGDVWLPLLSCASTGWTSKETILAASASLQCSHSRDHACALWSGLFDCVRATPKSHHTTTFQAEIRPINTTKHDA